MVRCAAMSRAAVVVPACGMGGARVVGSGDCGDTVHSLQATCAGHGGGMARRAHDRNGEGKQQDQCQDAPGHAAKTSRTPRDVQFTSG